MSVNQGLYNILGLAFSSNGDQLLSGADAVKLWNPAVGQLEKDFGDAGSKNTTAGLNFLPGNKQFLSNASRDNMVKLWDIAAGKEVRTLTGHKRDVFAVAFSPDGQTLASGGLDDTIKLWHVTDGRELRTLQVNSYVNAVAFSPDGQAVASASWDGTVKLWDVNSGQVLRDYRGHKGDVLAVAFSPDGRWVASGGR